jgi:hypothetical protein
LRDSGYDIIDTPLESDYDAIAAPNGGMAQIYIRDIDSKNWNDQPELSDLRFALDAFKSRTYIDTILVKYSGSDGYRVYRGNGNTLDLQTFFASKVEYPDAVNRIRGLDSTRSGDIILLAKNGWYFAEGIYKGEHGGLSQEESYIPLIFSGPTIRKGVTETAPASNIDMSRTLADLLGFSMTEADGIVLPVEEYRFINGTIIDNTNREGIAGVKVSTNTSLFTTTNSSGFYSFAVTSGTYKIMAQFEPVYYTNSSITVSTIGKAIVVQDIKLVKKLTGNIAGSIKHASLY